MVLKKLSKSIRLIGLMTFLSLQGVFSEEIFAQVIPDSSLGANSSRLNGDVIEGGANRGNNLFHSFTEFSIGEGQSFKFANPVDVTRIFSRVTGNQPSEIKGTLGVLGNADLFLINPRGIILGPNARLELRGSFIGTTADSVVFKDGIFSASNPESSTILSVNVPLGLQISATAGQILN
jgi:filamentous hemagglutinin family protein